jgi:hypothetical protein
VKLEDTAHQARQKPDRLFSLITPPAPDQMLKEQLDTIKRETSLKITLAVREHIRRKIEENNTTLPDLDPTNKLEAINIAKQRIRHNIGRNINHTEIEELANRYSEEIGASKTSEHSTDNSTSTRVRIDCDKIVRIQYPTATAFEKTINNPNLGPSTHTLENNSTQTQYIAQPWKP